MGKGIRAICRALQAIWAMCDRCDSLPRMATGMNGTVNVETFRGHGARSSDYGVEIVRSQAFNNLSWEGRLNEGAFKVGKLFGGDILTRYAPGLFTYRAVFWARP